MLNIFSYLEYREFLKDAFNCRKASDAFFSYRFMAQRTGLDSSFIAKILQGKAHLPEKAIPAFAKLFDLKDRELQFFELLLAFNKSKNSKESQILFEQLHQFSEVAAHTLRADQVEYFSHWYHPAIRAVIATGHFKGDFEQLAQTLFPAITIDEAQSSVELLMRLRLIQCKEHKYFVTDHFVKTEPEWQRYAVRKFQADVNAKANEAIHDCPPELRDFSTLTLSINESDFKEISHRLTDLRKSILKLVDQTENADRVYQLNLQCFPLAFAAYKGGSDE